MTGRSPSGRGQKPAGDKASDAPRTFALVGNPNSGKTTLFNSLTGLRQKVGNYPGVTVERKEGVCYGQHGETYRIIDLPGSYSLHVHSPDEEVLRDVLLGRRSDTPAPDAVICVADASNLDRHLYLVSQVVELGLPTIVVLNMMDIAESREIAVDAKALAEELGVPVIPMQANTREGLVELRLAMSRTDLPAGKHRVALPGSVPAEIAMDRSQLYLCECGKPLQKDLIDPAAWQDEVIATRYAEVDRLCATATRHGERPRLSTTDRIDRWLLHPFFGPAGVCLVLGLLFYLVFAAAEGPMHAIEGLFTWLANLVGGILPAGDFHDLVTDGIIAGVGGVLVFLPQIFILFFIIGLMEDTGYLSRVAFIMDRIMGMVGLNGRAFIPLLSSYACAVPAIMGARTIDNPRDRLVTILVAPWASCSARLPVYLLLLPLLVPGKHQFLALAGLYGLGTAGLMLFAWIFSRFLGRGNAMPAVIELPGYKRPDWHSILLQVWHRVRLFIRRAGTVILAVSILLWVVQTYPKAPQLEKAAQLEQSYAGRLGKTIEPVIAPLGFDWKIGIGLLASFAAREVFVSSMSISYSIQEEDEDIGLRKLREKFSEARRPDGTAVFSPLVCLSLLVFYVFALQCVSTVAVVRRETNSWRWAGFQFFWMTGSAYLASLLVFQIGRWLGFS
ncbi:MAG TPA: ferrous iron transport protein B [Verrucomicrobiales bacterium]|nr:ferrous iron transport protein B [Verrucomicrobiae bacterium]MCP5554579.1 ferrous iron transport protein B [Akkermansiaceae bacterium]HRX55268.1 ferrous iron transport protein B [Verrucomicrobiales bacterium]